MLNSTKHLRQNSNCSSCLFIRMWNEDQPNGRLLVSFRTVAPDAVCYLIRGRRFTVSSSLSWFLCFGVIRALGSSSRQKLRPQNLVCNFLEDDGLPGTLGGYTSSAIIKVLNKQPENRLCASDVKLYVMLQT